ncbi:hypothetical protein B0H13DRAFT_2341667 [Mycena leptocephala]|nr:hypothetical protein B0H13DRAFT_2341667 [Mycena leptocephala]
MSRTIVRGRTIYRAPIREVEGTVTNSNPLVNNAGGATLGGKGTRVTLHFGVERVWVGGLISLNFDSLATNSSIALSFTESPSFAPPNSENSCFPDTRSLVAAGRSPSRCGSSPSCHTSTIGAPIRAPFRAGYGVP